jgi:hypothetical protein
MRLKVNVFLIYFELYDISKIRHRHKSLGCLIVKVHRIFRDADDPREIGAPHFTDEPVPKARSLPVILKLVKQPTKAEPRNGFLTTGFKRLIPFVSFSHVSSCNNNNKKMAERTMPEKEFTFILCVSGENIEACHLFGKRADDIAIFLIAEAGTLKRTCNDLIYYPYKNYAFNVAIFLQFPHKV